MNLYQENIKSDSARKSRHIAISSHLHRNVHLELVPLKLPPTGRVRKFLIHIALARLKVVSSFV